MRRILFPYTLEGEAREWLERQPPGSMATWNEVVSKFLQNFFSPAKTLKLTRAITNFEQQATEGLAEAWERFKVLLRDCKHHGLSDEHVMRTFFGGLFEEAQSMLNSTSGGMFLKNLYAEAREILENISQNSFHGSEREKPARKQVNTIQKEEMSEIKRIVMNLT